MVKSFFQAEGGLRGFCLSRGLGDVSTRQHSPAPGARAAPLRAAFVNRAVFLFAVAILSWICSWRVCVGGEEEEEGPSLEESRAPLEVEEVNLALIHIGRCRRSRLSRVRGARADVSTGRRSALPDL